MILFRSGTTKAVEGLEAFEAVAFLRASVRLRVPSAVIGEGKEVSLCGPPNPCWLLVVFCHQGSIVADVDVSISHIVSPRSERTLFDASSDLLSIPPFLLSYSLDFAFLDFELRT